METQNKNNVTESEQLSVSEEQNDFLFDYEEVSISDVKSKNDLRIIPSSTREELTNFSKELDRDKFTELSTEEKATVGLGLETEDFINPDDIGVRSLKSGLTNEPEYDDISLKPKALTISKRVKTSKAALLKLKQKSGIGPNIHIPLWHSGFWLTYSPLDDEEIINLELELISELARVGKETSTLVFSNYNVLFAEVLLKHFKYKIIDSTLKISDEDELYDYININDLPTIALFMAKSMYPHGFNAVVPCKNVNKLNENKLPICSNKVSMKVDLNELLWVDFDKLSVDHKQQMAKKAPKSVTTDDVVKYQETLPTSGEVTKQYKDEDGDALTIVLGPVNVSKYIESGQDFIIELRDKAAELIKNNKQIGDSDKAERILLKGIYLNVYSHFIKSIPVDDAVITDVNDIRDALNTLTSNHIMAKQIMDDIKEYIDDSLLSIVGIPNFECKSCHHEQTDKEIIPLSVYEYFFILLHSKYEKIMARL